MVTETALIAIALEAREKAHPWKSGVQVGCAIETKTGTVAQGWNVEGMWETSIHAEVCAVLQLAALKEQGVRVVIVSDREFFTPCGSCRDWLLQFCIADAIVVIANSDNGRLFHYTLNQLCQYFPKR